MCFKTLFLVVSLFATCSVVHADAQLQTTSSTEAIPGDLDLDGDVDVADFLIFVENFGKTGSVPSQTPTTSVVTVYDTIYVDRGSESPERKRAENLLGFWKFKYTIISVRDRHYLLGRIDTEPNEDGEFYVWGTDEYGLGLVISNYSSGLEKYTLLDRGSILSYFYVFDIQGDRISGNVYLMREGETVSDASRYSLSSDSGRTIGEGFTRTTKPALPPQSELLDNRNNVTLPKEIADEYTRMKTILEAKIQR